MDALIATLDAAALDALAAAYRSYAAKAEARAAELRAIAATEARAAEAVAALKGLPDLIAAYVAAGTSASRAVDHVARATGTPAETVAWYWRAWLRSKDAATVEARHTLVMRLAGRGWRNDTIARHVGLHPVSVSRIVSGRLRPKKRGAP